MPFFWSLSFRVRFVDLRVCLCVYACVRYNRSSLSFLLCHALVALFHIITVDSCLLPSPSSLSSTTLAPLQKCGATHNGRASSCGLGLACSLLCAPQRRSQSENTTTAAAAVQKPRLPLSGSSSGQACAVCRGEQEGRRVCRGRRVWPAGRLLPPGRAAAHPARPRAGQHILFYLFLRFSIRRFCALLRGAVVVFSLCVCMCVSFSLCMRGAAAEESAVRVCLCVAAFPPLSLPLSYRRSCYSFEQGPLIVQTMANAPAAECGCVRRRATRNVQRRPQQLSSSPLSLSRPPPFSPWPSLYRQRRPHGALSLCIVYTTHNVNALHGSHSPTSARPLPQRLSPLLPQRPDRAPTRSLSAPVPTLAPSAGAAGAPLCRPAAVPAAGALLVRRPCEAQVPQGAAAARPGGD